MDPSDAAFRQMRPPRIGPTMGRRRARAPPGCERACYDVRSKPVTARIPTVDEIAVRTVAVEPIPSLDAGAPYGPLPYGPRIWRVIRPLHEAFGVVNRWVAAPALRAGLGPLLSTPLTGSLMLLRTTGRRSGLTREAPLGYVIREGSIYCCAGFGRRTAWYRNLVDEPRVEVILPTVAVSGLAETVTDRSEWDRLFPAYVRALGLIGRVVLGDLDAANADRRESLRVELPLVRIRPTGLASGPADAGGGFWIVVQTVCLLVVVRSAIRAGRRVRRAERS
jgi:deazaflavin-dependent oxidoreductase (nitroreductase family)